MKVRVVPHDPTWSEEFVAEAERIRSVLGSLKITVHHIGSTAVPSISAKPIIDILLVVDDLPELDSRSSDMAGLGYEAKGEFGIPGRRYFRKESADGVRTHQVHAFERASAGVERHLAFRDYMITHPDEARAYSLLKERLATSYPEDIEAYMDGKDSFIKNHEARAIDWRRQVQSAGCTERRDRLSVDNRIPVSGHR